MAAYGTELGMDYKTALKIASAFGGGMGRRGETCGAVTGAYMVISLKHGAKDADDEISKLRAYELVKEFTLKFKDRNKTDVCNRLLGFNIASENELTPDSFRIIMQQCPSYVKDAAEILEEILGNEKNRKEGK